MTGGDLAIILAPLFALVAFVEALAIATLRDENRKLQRDYDRMHEATNQAIVAAKDVQDRCMRALGMQR